MSKSNVDKKKRTDKEIANEKSNRIMEGVAVWTGFYRCNPQRFVEDYLNVNLKLFQKFLLWAMMRNDKFMYIASRGQGKTWLVALFCICRCILYPKTGICVASKTRTQGNEVLEKIEKIFMKMYDWGSENLRREIDEKNSHIGAADAEINFYNGSFIKVVTASDSSRGNRANVLVIDEFRMVELDTINTVLKRFLTATRQPGYLKNPKYSHLVEENKEMYMSSAWYQDHWSFTKFRSYFMSMIYRCQDYFVCSLPYQLALKEGLLTEKSLQDEMSEDDFDEIKFSMEMESLFFGDADGSFFSFDNVDKRRTLKKPIYPTYMIASKSVKIPDLVDDERRILSVDVALMASNKHKNDASSIMINRAIPTNENYVANIVYTENFEGLNTDELALVVRRMYEMYKCTDLVIDTMGQGIGVYDKLIQDIVDPESGELYHALSCCNDKDMAARCKVPNAPEVIWSVKASAAFNNEICITLRNGFKTNKINLLIDEFEGEEVIKSDIKGFSKLTAYEKTKYKMPYVNTTLLVNELVKLEYEVKGNNVKLKEKTGMRKDRYSSLAYNYWVQCQLEREVLRKSKKGFDAADYAKRLGKLNHKPVQY